MKIKQSIFTLNMTAAKIRSCIFLPLYMTFANPRGWGCFRGTRFPREFPIPRTNERLRREKRSVPKEPFSSSYSRSCPSTVHDASSNWKRRSGNARERGRRRGRVRNAEVLLKEREASNKKGVSLDETPTYIVQIEFDAARILFFSLVSPLPLFDISSIMKIEQTHVSNGFQIKW